MKKQEIEKLQTDLVHFQSETERLQQLNNQNVVRFAQFQERETKLIRKAADLQDEIKAITTCFEQFYKTNYIKYHALIELVQLISISDTHRQKELFCQKVVEHISKFDLQKPYILTGDLPF